MLGAYGRFTSKFCGYLDRLPSQIKWTLDCNHQKFPTFDLTNLSTKCLAMSARKIYQLNTRLNGSGSSVWLSHPVSYLIKMKKKLTSRKGGRGRSRHDDVRQMILKWIHCQRAGVTVKVWRLCPVGKTSYGRSCCWNCITFCCRISSSKCPKVSVSLSVWSPYWEFVTHTLCQQLLLQVKPNRVNLGDAFWENVAPIARLEQHLTVTWVSMGHQP